MDGVPPNLAQRVEGRDHSSNRMFGHWRSSYRALLGCLFVDVWESMERLLPEKHRPNLGTVFLAMKGARPCLFQMGRCRGCRYRCLLLGRVGQATLLGLAAALGGPFVTLCTRPGRCEKSWLQQYHEPSTPQFLLLRFTRWGRIVCTDLTQDTITATYTGSNH